MKRSTLIYILIVGCGSFQMSAPLNCQAQLLTPTVASSSGGFFANSSGQLSYTLSEMTMVQMFSQANNMLTQGYQQAFDLSAYVPQPVKENFNFGVFPNPSAGSIHLIINAKNNSIVNLRLVNALGKTVASDHFYHPAGVNSYAYNWNNLSTGMYMLELTLTDPVTNMSSQSMKKINIIY